MPTLWQDLRFAARGFARTPGFATIAVATLAIGIATNTTVFAWVDALLLRPVPGVPEARQLMAMEGISPGGGRLGGFPHPDFRDFQRQMTLASGVTAAHMGFFTIGSATQSQRVLGQVVSANYFTVLGVNPYLGRLFLPAEDVDTPGAHPIAVISHRLWTAHFRGEAGAVGRTVTINGHSYTIVGVTPPDFTGTIGGAALDVWVPLSRIIQIGMLNTWAAADRNARFLNVILRLKPGVTADQARQQARTVADHIAAIYPDTHKGIGATMVPMSEASYGLQASLRNPLRILMAICVLVLLIACANVANLLMARTISRRREFGIRIALGAGRAKLLRQAAVEVLMLAGAGAVAGVLLAQWMGESLLHVLPGLDSTVRLAIEPLLRPRTNWTVLWFTAAITVAAAMLSTILPAWYSGQVDVNSALKEGGRTGTPGHRSHRARSALVVAEVALASVAMIGAAIAVRTFQKFAKIDLGFEPRQVLVAHFHLSTNGYSLDREKQFSRDLKLRLESSPAIQQVTYADSVPLSIFSGSSERVQALGPETDDRGVVSISRTITAPGYFSLMGIPLVEGRDFTDRDDRKTPNVMIVNEAFASRYFPGRSALGQKLRVSGWWATIVGVARNARYHTPQENATPYFYGSFGQMFWSGHNHFLYVRAHDLDAARAVVRREIAALDPNKGLYELSTLTEYTQAGLLGERVAASLLSALAVLALALAAVGLYSVMGYAVSERTQEIGIRLALGARQAQVLGTLLREGMALTVAGLAAGTLGSIAAARVLASALNAPVTSGEPQVFLLPAAVLLVVALLASYVPARRAMKMDPLAALRRE